MKKLIFALAACVALAFVSCTKENVSPEDNPGNNNNSGNSTAAQAYVLNEGSWGGNNAELSLLNIENGSATATYFSAVNGRGLGDVAQDLVAYGSKLYCVVWGSNTIEVINPATGRSIQQISMGSKGPRYIACYGGNVYVTCYDRTVARIDTASYQITGSCTLSGLNPEGIAYCNGKLYVCNSNESDANYNYTFDNTLSVVDLASFTEEKKITVPENPTRIKALANGKLVVVYGNGYNNPAGMTLVDPATDALTDLSADATGMDVMGNDIYCYKYDYATMSAAFWKIDGNSASKTTILSGTGVSFVAPYGINVNPSNGDIYVTDAQDYSSNGDVHCFAANGTHKWSAEVALLPSKVVFF